MWSSCQQLCSYRPDWTNPQLAVWSPAVLCLPARCTAGHDAASNAFIQLYASTVHGTQQGGGDSTQEEIPEPR
jgi:hypothetical protein